MLNKSSRLTLLAIAVVVIISAVLVWDLIDTNKFDSRKSSPQDQTDKNQISEASYVGKESCINCHQRQYDLWLRSHHDLAMQVANDSTVLGDFNNSKVTHFGVTSKFYRRNNNFYVETEGLDGKNHEYQVSYTFGVTPLQQYLVRFPDGRYQVLPLCWDTRPAIQG
jgi:hypothetical protein